MKPRRSLKIGDLVLIADENVRHGNWPSGKVVDVFRGKDGHVRSVFPVFFARFLSHLLYFKLSFWEGFRFAFINSVFSFLP